MANNDYNENYYENENPEINDIEGEEYPEIVEEPVSLFNGTGGMGLGNIFKGGKNRKPRPQEDAPRAGRGGSRAAYREEDYDRRGAGYDDDATGFSASELREPRQYREETVKPAREPQESPFDRPVRPAPAAPARPAAAPARPAAAPYVSPAKAAFTGAPRLVMYTPTEFDDSIRTVIAPKFLQNYIVGIDLSGADKTVQMRVLDFLSGVLFAVKGNHYSRGENIHFFLPEGVNFEEGTLSSGESDSETAYSPSKSAVDTGKFL